MFNGSDPSINQSTSGKRTSLHVLKKGLTDAFSVLPCRQAGGILGASPCYQGAQENERAPELEVGEISPLQEELQTTECHGCIISRKDWEEEGQGGDVVRRQGGAFFQITLKVENTRLTIEEIK